MILMTKMIQMTLTIKLFYEYIEHIKSIKQISEFIEFRGSPKTGGYYIK